MSKEYSRIFTIAGHPALSKGIICLDDMEDLLKWTKFEGGGDAIFELDPNVSYTKNQSLYLKSRVVGAANGDQIGADRYLHYPPSRKVTYTFVFRQLSGALVEFWSFECSYFDGTNKHFADLRYYPGTPNWQYRNSGGTYTALANTAISMHSGTWHRLSFTIDFSTGEYVNATLDNHTLLSSRVALHVDTNPTAEHLFVRFLLETAGADSIHTHLDSFTAIEV